MNQINQSSGSEFNFLTLTPDKIIDGLESAGFDVASGLLPLNSYENRVYQFHDEARNKYVTKFYRPQRWSTEQIQEELDFALELAAEDVPVVPPIQRDQQSLFEFDGFLFAVFPCRGGRIFEVDNLDQLEWMGRFVGRIHAVGQRRPFHSRPVMSPDEYLLQSVEVLKQSGSVPPTLAEPFFTVLMQVVSLATDAFVQHRAIRLHGDCHAGNILWTEQGPHFVDLDDCRMGPAIQDLWMMLSGDRQQQMIQLDTILSGYEEFQSFDSRQLNLIESLRSMRVIHYMAWLAKRWQDPAFPRNFPWFATDKYWEQQILMLKEQFAALNEPALTLF